jgi:solute carrier family 25 S-adenosylmethionine transporter 26
VAGTSVDLLFYPVDTIKTRLQSEQGFLRAGGFRGIYKGVGSVVIGSAPGGTLLPTFQEHYKLPTSGSFLLSLRWFETRITAA